MSDDAAAEYTPQAVAGADDPSDATREQSLLLPNRLGIHPLCRNGRRDTPAGVPHTCPFQHSISEQHYIYPVAAPAPTGLSPAPPARVPLPVPLVRTEAGQTPPSVPVIRTKTQQTPPPVPMVRTKTAQAPLPAQVVRTETSQTPPRIPLLILVAVWAGAKPESGVPPVHAAMEVSAEVVQAKPNAAALSSTHPDSTAPTPAENTADT